MFESEEYNDSDECCGSRLLADILDKACNKVAASFLSVGYNSTWAIYFGIQIRIT